MTRTLIRVLFAFVAATLITGCVSMTPPKRDAYTGADKVKGVDAKMIVGTWNGKVLNPIEGENLSGNSFKIEFLSNGKSILTSTADHSKSGMGRMVLEVIGTWSIVGETIVSEAKSVKEISGNKLGGFMASMMNSYKQKMSGTSNVYEISNDRIVWVSEESGMAQELIRIKN